MINFTRTFQLIAGILSVPVFGLAIIGVNYTSPFLFHLADIVNGTNTSVVASTNAPNWAIGTSLANVIGVSTATSTGGTLATSTSYGFQISAIDVNGGTTTLSALVTGATDSTPTGESILLKWASLPGAAGYAIFFGTSSPSVLTQFFYATSSSASTSTQQYVFATSTGSLSGSYTKTDTTAFNTEINPIGPSFIEGNNGTATSSPIASSSALEINGNLRVQSNGTTTACFAQTAGAVFYNTANNHEWGCNGTVWTKIF
jgi:hypothetical protein